MEAQSNNNHVGTLLRLEGLGAFIASLVVYHHLEGEWLPFFVLLLLPDITMLGYALDVRVGSIVYNLGHTYSAPLVLLGIAYITDWHTGFLLACIWFAHIGIDRIFGYGLKYPTHFKDTHFGRL